MRGMLATSAHPEPVEGSGTSIATTLRQAQGERGLGRNGPARFAGYAAIFDAPDRGGDVIHRGAFARSLEAVRNVPLLWQHDRARVVGTIERIEEDGRGLRVIGRLADGALLRRAGGLSFGYRVRAGRETGVRRRELTELDLVEVSLVVVPMQPLARVHAVAV